MPFNTKMELHDTPTSKLAEIKAISPVILLNGDNKYTPNDICKMVNFWWIIYVRFDGSRRQVVKMIAVVTFSSLAAVFRLLHRTPVVQYMMRFNRLLLSGVTFLISRNRKLK